MTELLTAAQMRAIEEAAIASGEVTGLELMERAGAGVVEAIFEEWPDFAKAPHIAVILCGPGNNGGDGFVVARLLKAQGWYVEVFLYGDPDKLPPDAKANYERWCGQGEWVGEFDHRLGGVIYETQIDIIVDALFGTGLTRGLPDDLGECSEVFDLFKSPVVAEFAPKIIGVDMPSGISSDNGKIVPNENFKNSFFADLTVSFHSEKIGHRISEGPEYCGKIVTKDIGLKGCPAVPPGEVVKLVDGPSSSLSKTEIHKYSHGHALILSGSMGRSGAARLAARGALRVGAGVVTVGAPGPAMMECANQLTAIMLRKLDDADAIAEALEDSRINALCVGPGLGLSRAKTLVPAALKAGRATVLDADALSGFADDPDSLFALLHPDCVLTPHHGEFTRLFPDIAEKLAATPIKGPAYSKVDATREAAARAGCTVLFKGPDTVIANENGHAAINSSAYERAAPWLATAGSGDVLAGFICGLLARGFGPFQAAETGAWLHTECALSFGPGLIAEDLPEQLPKVFAALDIV